MRDHTKLRAFELADLCADLIDYSLNNLSSYRELHYQLGLSKRLGYFDENSFIGCDSKIEETEKVLGSLIRSLRRPNRLQSKQPE